MKRVASSRTNLRSQTNTRCGQRQSEQRQKSNIMLLFVHSMRHTNGSCNIDKVKLIENEIRLNGWPAADLPFPLIE